VPDFRSALYLGIGHGSGTLAPWASLTTGAPDALLAVPGAAGVAGALARMQGHEAGFLAPSTLHLFHDLFAAFAGGTFRLLADAALYPVARWGVERAACALGMPVHPFAHLDAAALAAAARESGRRPVVVTDGFCPVCGAPAPLRDYLRAIRPLNGVLVLDDTQALGVLGAGPTRDVPWGRGGGGTPAWARALGPDVLSAASLAKGFGVPCAVLAGSRPLVDRVMGQSDTRVSCSPPSAADVSAALAAMGANRRHGEELRGRLLSRVTRFRVHLRRSGIVPLGMAFPIQCVARAAGTGAATLYSRLGEEGITAVLVGGHHGEPLVCFAFTADHTERDVDEAAAALARAADRGAGRRRALVG
jgi:8-amino-7-oxononanoate synthase